MSSAKRYQNNASTLGTPERTSKNHKLELSGTSFLSPSPDPSVELHCEQQPTISATAPTASGSQPLYTADTSVQSIPIADITIDPEFQSRVELNNSTVKEYAELMEDGYKFPPVAAYRVGSQYFLVDGNHRVKAALKLNWATIECTVYDGTKRDALIYAAGVNFDHGLPRTMADKRCVVTRVLNDLEWCQWSDRDIANRCKVSHTFVSKVRKDLTGNVASDDEKKTRVCKTKHGTTTTMTTAKIGKKPLPAQATADGTDESPAPDVPEPAPGLNLRNQ